MISEPVLIRLFCNGWRPSICSQTEQEVCQKNICDQGTRKPITAEAKAALNLPSLVREMDAHYPQGHCFASKPTKDYTQNQSFLPFRPYKAQTMLPHYSKPPKTKKPHRDHQKDRRKKNCCNRSHCSSKPQGSTSATEVNATKTPAQNDCGSNQAAHLEDKSLSQTTCYTCNKKGHFAN